MGQTQVLTLLGADSYMSRSTRQANCTKFRRRVSRIANTSVSAGVGKIAVTLQKSKKKKKKKKLAPINNNKHEPRAALQLKQWKVTFFYDSIWDCEQKYKSQ